MSSTDEANNVTYVYKPSTDYPFIPCFVSWLLIEPSSDTVYMYSSGHRLRPFIVRTPPVQSMNPEVFLFLSLITDRYYFMETIKKEFNFKTQKGFPTTDLLYDKQEKNLFKYTVYNDDYSNKEKVYMNYKPINSEILNWQPLQADRLVEAYGQGELKGRLKEIAAQLNEESNPVLMLFKHKK